MSADRTRARLLRLGDQLLTSDGWQTIRGLLIFEDSDQVTVFTDERDDDHTSGWSFTLTDHVITRPAPRRAGPDSASEQGVTESCDMPEKAAGLDSAPRPDVPDVGDIALSRDVTSDRDMPTIAKHYETAAWKGDEPGECGAECACGVTYDGFDSLAEAGEFLGRHIKAGNAKPSCPDWCVEHYDGGDRNQERNHAGFPHSARVADVWTGEPLELGLWLERRDDRETGETETFGVLEVKRLASDVELTVEDMRYLAAKLWRLADTAARTPDRVIGNCSPPPPQCRCRQVQSAGQGKCHGADTTSRPGGGQ